MNLYNAILDLSETLGILWQGAASAGATTTQAASTEMPHAAGYFTGGTAFIAGASRVISSHTLNTVNWATAASALSAGATFWVGSPRFPRSVLVQAINQALGDLSPIEAWEDITTVDSQRYYTEADVALAVEVESASGEADWSPNYHWTQNDGVIEFDDGFEPAGGVTMRVKKLVQHPRLSLDADAVSDQINPERLRYSAAVHAIRWRMTNVRNDEPELKDLLQQMQAQAQMAAVNHPARRAPQPRMARY